MIRRFTLLILLALFFILPISCGGGGGGTNPVIPYGPPPGGEPQEEEPTNILPYPVEIGPLPDPTMEIYYDTSTDRDGQAVIPGFARANKRSSSYLPMRVRVVESDGDPLRHMIVRRMLLGEDFGLIVWDPTGFYNPRIIHSSTLNRTGAFAKVDRAAMLTEVLGKENPATTNIGFGSDSIDISIGLDKVSDLHAVALSSYWTYFTDDNLINNINQILMSNIFGGNMVKFAGTYTRWNLPDAISTLTSQGALIYIGGYVDLLQQKLSTFQMGTEADDLDEDPMTNSLVTPRIPTNFTNCYTVFSSMMQVSQGLTPSAVASNFENVFSTHPLYQNLGDEQRYVIIFVKPIIDIASTAVTASTTKVKTIIIVLPVDPREITIQPEDNSLMFSSGITKIFRTYADYTVGAKHNLAPTPSVENWFRNRVITNIDPVLPGDVIAQPGQGLLPSATFLAELNRHASVTHFIRDYIDDEELKITSNMLLLTPEGGSVTNLAPDLTKAKATPTSGRAPLTVTFDATETKDPDGKIISYEWNFGNPDVPGGGTDTGATVQHTYASPGVRTAILTAKDDGTPQRTVMKQFSITITANQSPVAVIKKDVSSGRAPLTVNFDGTASYDPDGSIASFFWDFGDGQFSMQATPEHVFTNPDTYTVTLTVTDNGPSPPKSDIETTQVQVLPASTNRPPVASFSADPESGPAPLTVQFDSSASYDPDGDTITYQWYFGDSGVVGGGSSNEPNPSYVYNTVQNATVTLIVRDNGDPPLEDFIEKEIVVTEPSNDPPVAVIKAIPDAGPAPLQVNFSGADSYDPDGQITGYSWNFGDPDQPDGGTAFGSDVSYTYNSNGVFIVTLVVSDDGTVPQQDTEIYEIVVGNSRPIADIQASTDNGYAPLTVDFDATGSSDPDGDNIVSYLWDFAGLGLDDQPVTSFTFDEIGEYKVTLTVTDDSTTPIPLSGKAELIITVTEAPPNSPPVVIIKTDQYYGNSPLDVQFNSTDESYDPDGDDIVVYLWDFGDSSPTSSEPNPMHTFQFPGEYMVTCSLTDDADPPMTGQETQFIYVDVNVPPVSIAEANVYEGNMPLTVQFTGSNSYDPDGAVIEYNWDFGTGSDFSDLPDPSFMFEFAGDYDVTLTVKDNGVPQRQEVDTITIKVKLPTINLAPTARIIAMPTSGRAPLEVNFSASMSTDPDGEITEYLWNFGDPNIPGGGTSTDMITSHEYLSPGNFTATLTVWDNGTPRLTDDDEVTIRVN